MKLKFLPFLLVLFLPLTVKASCTSPCVQQNSVVVNGAGNPSVAYTSAVTAHHLLIAVDVFGNTPGTMSDTSGNNWIGAVQANNGTVDQIWYVCDSIAAGAGANTVTYTYTTQFYSTLHIYEFDIGAHPLTTNTCLDQVGNSVGSANDGTVNGTISTAGSVSQSTEFVFASFDGNHGSVTSITPAAGQTSLTTTTTTPFFTTVTRDSFNNATTGLSGVITLTATADLAPTFWANTIATFKITTAMTRHKAQVIRHKRKRVNHAQILTASL